MIEFKNKIFRKLSSLHEFKVKGIDQTPFLKNIIYDESIIINKVK